MARYRLLVDWAPPYELLASLNAFTFRTGHKTLELDAGWTRETRARLPRKLLDELTGSVPLAHVDLIQLLVWQCEGDRSVEGFLAWVESLGIGEIYERLVGHLASPRRALPDDLATFRDRSVRQLSEWNDAYFSGVDPAILRSLRVDAGTKTQLNRTVPPDELLESATGGFILMGDDEPESILLVPHWHMRPWNMFTTYKTMVLIEYPVDALPRVPGEPPPAVLRLARALSDESRLRILRLVAQEPRTFTDLVGQTGLSKSTVNHHMVLLRAAGLVRVQGLVGARVTYSLQSRALDTLRDRLADYLNDEE